MKHYIALTLIGERPELELVLAFGSTLPTTGVVDNDDALVFYFDEPDFTEQTIEEIRSWLPEDSGMEFETGTVEEQNWNAEFEQSLQPVRVAENLVFTQSWNPVSPTGPDDLVVVIDPKMSFGTGHHESTRLISKLMMELDFTGRRVLDIGTGTGVLAIIAAQKGASSIIAIDNNEWAVDNTVENLTLNAISSELVEVRLCELDGVPEGPFEIVLANMHRNVIMELLPTIVEKLPSEGEGYLLTSGILFADYESLVEAARTHGLKPVAEEQENEWIATTWARA